MSFVLMARGNCGDVNMLTSFAHFIGKITNSKRIFTVAHAVSQSWLAHF
jgi:hypothetical protein